jgi:uncharacterized protein
MLICFIVLTLSSGCSKKTNTLDIKAYQEEIKQWQDKRTASLTRENGWLTLCGLFWLKEGENTFGSDSSNTIVFPIGKAPKVAGSVWLEKGKLRLQARPGIELRYKDSLVSSLVMQSDEGKVEPTILTTNTLSFYTIKRGEQFGVRVKDKENSARIHFKGLEYFPIDPKWRIEAKFEAYNPPKVIQIATIINTVENDTCPGTLVFDVDGATYRLDAVLERGTPDQIFIMFSDETSGKETYGLGRQLYADMPDVDNEVILDFNKAYNWPCAYTEFATCPIPPRQNHLSLLVQAGEKKYPGSDH